MKDEKGAKILSFVRRRGTASTVKLLSEQGLVTL
jgi:hypothetical protein